jgi:hypothetical protein
MAKKLNLLDYAVQKPIQTLVFVGFTGIAIFFIKREITKYVSGKKSVSGGNPYNWQKFIINIDDVIARKKLTPNDYADFSQKSFNDMAKQVYDAMGITDNFPKVKQVYQKFTNKYSFAKFVRTFEQTYQKDLRAWLSDGYYWNPAGGFSDAQINELNNYINSLPDLYILK